jgi:hypothetical protein
MSSVDVETEDQSQRTRHQQAKAPFSGEKSGSFGWGITLAGLLGVFVFLQCFLPLGSAIRLGADEDFELAKATLCVNGHKLYSEVWNDHPPLHTFIITQVLKYVSPSALGPRLVTSAFAVLLLSSVFLITLRLSGLLVAALTTALLICSPAFLELSASCMLEMPSLGTAVASLCVLVVVKPSRWYAREVIGAGVFAGALMMKVVPVVLIPLALLILFRSASTPGKVVAPYREFLVSALCFLGSIPLAIIGIDLLVDRGAYLLHFGQSWVSHFGSAKSSEYGSAADYPFDWSVLLKNWDTTIPAMLGLIVMLRSICRSATPQGTLNVSGLSQLSFEVTLCSAWLALSFTVFSIHRPWWTYYYIHTAIPLCWCAAIGVKQAFRWSSENSKPLAQAQAAKASVGGWLNYRSAALSVFLLTASVWGLARAGLQIGSMRASPSIAGSLVLGEISRFKPFTSTLYTDQPIYSFHCGIPLPPRLAVLPLKRFWSGDMTTNRLTQELTAAMPGLILLPAHHKEVPFQSLLDSDYRLVYHDNSHRLFAHRSISRKAQY